ncbi:MAG: hypothetical protein LBC31_00570 [Treponema sp.]|jgi:hypothetical protein|nr:hypothetical protein [Treponema sp.]
MMKKLAILFLLTALVGSFAFAIDGIGDFKAQVELSFDNLTGGNDGDVAIGIEPQFIYSRSFGAFGLEAGVGDYLEIPTGDTADKADAADFDKFDNDLYVYVKPSYSLEAGPGTLGFALTIKPKFHLTSYKGDTKDADFIINPAISYTGIDVGVGSLGFELATDDMGLYDGENEDRDGYGLKVADLYFKASFALSSIPLSFWVSPRLTIATNDAQGDTELSSIRFDGTYAFSETMNAGLEVRLGLGDTFDAEGVMLKPHFNASFGAIGAWAAVEISQLGADVKDDIQIKPIVGASYSF